MFRTDYFHCSQGIRNEQLDRFVATDTGRCTIFMLADGYSCCSVNPHYVDWLAERVSHLQASELCCKNAMDVITQLIAQTECYPGRASVAFVISDNRCYHYSTLGDTRIYWPQEYDRTHDHSIAQLAVQRGECLPEQLRFHPFRNRLIRHAGAGQKYHLEWQTRPMSENEYLLLCSDGFWSQVDDIEIFRAADSAGVRGLVARVMDVKPPDNLSVVTLKSASTAFMRSVLRY